MINWDPSTIWTGDSVEIMRGMNSESVDLIYLDPPFNSNANYAAPIGSPAAGAAFKDTWALTDIDVEWVNLIEEKHPALNRLLLAVSTDNDKAYLIYMTARILEMYRILKPTGAIYLHCDPTMSHYLKLIMDLIFGRNAFRNEIIWQRNYSSGKGSQHDSRKFGANTDTILFYTKTDNYFIKTTLDVDKNDPDILAKFNKIDKDGRRYQLGTPLFRAPSMGERPNLCYEWRGFQNPHPSGWRLSKERLEEEYQKGNIVIRGGRLERRQYLDDYAGLSLDNNWTDIPRAPKNERTGYPTQKPLALLRRIIQASSNEGDVVLDPFCGCATACVAAEELGRTWVGIDISPKAAELVVSRIKERQGFWRDIVHRTDIPKRTDLGAIPLYSSKENKEKLYGLQGGHCAGCKTHFMTQHLEVDHIIAQRKGGSDHIDNLQLLCGNCNRIKGDRGMNYLRTKLQLT